MLEHDTSRLSHDTAFVSPPFVAKPPTVRLRVAVVIPTLNEEHNLQHVLPRIPSWVDEVIIVDGRSTDNTVAEARRLLPSVRIVTEHKPGKGSALQAGFRAATGHVIVMLDADGSMDPGEIPSFLFALLAGADYVKGSRFLQGAATDDMELYRRAGNAALRLLVRAAFGGRYSDLCYGYNAFWRDCASHFYGDAPGFEIETFMNIRALKANLHVVEVPSYEAARVHGASNLHAVRDGMRVLRTIVKEGHTRLRPGDGAPLGQGRSELGVSTMAQASV
jgi:glycosyltransferase involved in cell wall biosynthesis